jgi:hypothetical protein
VKRRKLNLINNMLLHCDSLNVLLTIMLNGPPPKLPQPQCTTVDTCTSQTEHTTRRVQVLFAQCIKCARITVKLNLCRLHNKGNFTCVSFKVITYSTFIRRMEESKFVCRQAVLEKHLSSFSLYFSY